MKELAEKRLADIVSEGFQVVPVLEKYHLDYCCKGKMTLAEACRQNMIPLDKVIFEMETIGGPAGDKAGSFFHKMTLTELIQYIIARHHVFVRRSLPVINDHLEKVANKHGERYPHMVKVRDLFAELTRELTMHVEKEEHILFPAIHSLEETEGRPGYLRGHSISLPDPVHMMEIEHEHVGKILENIRNLTQNYIPPVNACTMHKLSLHELKGFEEDLHQHVYLENHLLFPGALEKFREKRHSFN